MISCQEMFVVALHLLCYQRGKELLFEALYVTCSCLKVSL
jgi:hypothetical protein